jgi:hypothetical protein
MSPPSFPRTVPCSGAHFPPRGPSGWFPRFTGTVKHSDFLPPFPRRFVAFASRYRRCALGSLPPMQGAASAGRGLFTGLPKTGSSTEATGAPRFLEDPIVYMPCSQTPAGPRRSATTALRCCLPPYARRRLPRQLYFVAQSHGLHTRCLRFAGWITPPPRKTRFRLAGLPFPGGTRYPLGPNERFQITPPPLPGFAWRTHNIVTEKVWAYPFR